MRTGATVLILKSYKDPVSDLLIFNAALLLNDLENQTI
jgi:hypothetical protein